MRIIKHLIIADIVTICVVLKRLSINWTIINSTNQHKKKKINRQNILKYRYYYKGVPANQPTHFDKQNLNN